MKIPKEIEIFAEKVKVIKTDSLKRSNTLGEAHARYNEIILDETQQPDMMESTFFHELVHIILGRIGEEELNDNEKFVNVFSGVLHQALKDCLK